MANAWRLSVIKNQANTRNTAIVDSASIPPDRITECKIL